MRNNFAILVLFVVFALNTTAQKINADKVPDAVKNSFTTMFGNTLVTEWELEDGNYEATYTLRGVESAALFKKDGGFIQYEWKVNAADVPEAARKYMTTNYPNKKIVDYTRIKNVAGAISYEIDATGEDYFFDSNGNFISVEKEPINDEK
jgi:hypothetical protein